MELSRVVSDRDIGAYEAIIKSEYDQKEEFLEHRLQQALVA